MLGSLLISSQQPTIRAKMSAIMDTVPHVAIPPFPPTPPNVCAPSFASYQVKGLRVQRPSAGSSSSRVTDYLYLPLVAISAEASTKPVTPSVSSVGLDNAWRIGDEDSDWVEPPATSIAEYLESQPPFTRLMTAANEFSRSRMQAFAFARYKRLFGEMKSSFGLNTKFVGHHRPGKGEHAESYMYISSIRREHTGVMEGEQEESCVFLAKMVPCVRGFLALARREAEAGWTVDPAVELARITASFLAFVVHYKVLPETEYANDLREALALARSAARHLRLATEFENVVMDKKGVNRLSWTLWGGSYNSTERGGNVQSKDEPEQDEDDGGWTVNDTPFRADVGLSHDEAETLMQGLLPNSDLSSIHLLAYIPFSRRKATAITPTGGAVDPPCPFASPHICVRTTAAPWTADEAWKYHHHDAGAHTEHGDTKEERELETERLLGEEPETMDIWVEAGHDWSDGVGMGLRGRWALVGASAERAWWIFRARDYVLPAYWQP